MTIQINLPRPLSTNHLFANVEGKGRVKSKRYQAWCWRALAMIQDQKPLPKIDYPCRILFAVGTKGISEKMDGDNVLKCLIDSLVENNVLPDDNRTVIRGVGMEWVDGKEGVTAHISRADLAEAVDIELMGCVW